MDKVKGFTARLIDRIFSSGNTEKERKSSSTRRMLLFLFLFCLTVVCYDIHRGSKIDNGVVLNTVSQNVYSFLEMLFMTVSSLYGLRRGTEAYESVSHKKLEADSNKPKDTSKGSDTTPPPTT